jgi:hypothetical protein
LNPLKKTGGGLWQVELNQAISGRLWLENPSNGRLEFNQQLFLKWEGQSVMIYLPIFSGSQQSGYPIPIPDALNMPQMNISYYHYVGMLWKLWEGFIGISVQKQNER